MIVRRLIGENNPLKNWGKKDQAITSQLAQVEVLRTLENARLHGRIDDEEIALSLHGLKQIFSKISKIHLDYQVLKKASGPFPVTLKTLDAIHLASALLWKEQFEKDITFLTHDVQLGRAVLAMGLEAKGF